MFIHCFDAAAVSLDYRQVVHTGHQQRGLAGTALQQDALRHDADFFSGLVAAGLAFGGDADAVAVPDVAAVAPGVGDAVVAAAEEVGDEVEDAVGDRDDLDAGNGHPTHGVGDAQRIDRRADRIFVGDVVDQIEVGEHARIAAVIGRRPGSARPHYFDFA